MGYKDDVDDLSVDEDDIPSKKRNNNRKRTRTVFSVWEIDTYKDNTPSYCTFESFGNPIPCLRYAAKLNARSKRHKYIVSPRPNQSAIKAANV